MNDLRLQLRLLTGTRRDRLYELARLAGQSPSDYMRGRIDLAWEEAVRELSGSGRSLGVDPHRIGGASQDAPQSTIPHSTLLDPTRAIRRS